MAGLGRYLVRRAITFIPTIFGVVLISFTIAFVMPADPARTWAGGQKASPRVVENIRKTYHLDDPFWVQFYYFLRNVLTNRIYSPVTHNSVFYEFSRRFPITLNLAIMSMFFIVVIGIPLGIIAALKKDTAIDNAVRILALIGYSTPSFWIAFIFMWVFYNKLRWMTLVGLPTPSKMITGIYVLDALILGEFDIFIAILRRLLLPAFILAFISVGGLARYVRNSMLDVLSADFVWFGRAKGLPPFRLWRHALKNSLIPVVTVVFFMFGGLLGGAIITETVFGIPGLGVLYYSAISNLDIPVIVLTTLYAGVIIVVISLIVDIIYAIIDPRIRF